MHARLENLVNAFPHFVRRNPEIQELLVHDPNTVQQRPAVENAILRNEGWQRIGMG